MKFSVRHLAFFLAAFTVLLPAMAFAEVKVELKNGRTIIADFCEEAGASLTCSKMGGMFEIEKKDIVRVSKVEDGNGGSYEGTADGMSSPQGAEQEMPSHGRGVREAPTRRVTGASGRLDEIRNRKSELAPEREKLLKEREKLQEELKKSPDWMPVNQYEELQKRNAELDKKIREYNEEVGRLNAEEKDIGDKGKKKD
jgi:hypothetical protein